MRILIVEDEALLVRRMQKMLAEILPEAKTECCYSIAETVAWLSTHEHPDIIFMDIELADGKSFEIFSQVSVKSPVIFTTAYDEYALRAFEVNSIDYLLKPVQKEDVQKALDKLQALRADGGQDRLYRLIEEMAPKNNAGFRDRILVKQGQKLVSFNTEDAGLFVTQNGITFLITKSNQKYMVGFTLDQLEQSLDPKKFYRANRQHIISYTIIRSVQQWFNGKLKIEMTLALNEPVIVSRDKAPFFKNWLGE